jgi:hypothetical protein
VAEETPNRSARLSGAEFDREFSVRRDKQVSKYRTVVLILIIIIVFAAVAAPIAVIVFQQEASQKEQQETDCAILRSEIRNHEDLADIRRVLGLPMGPPIPEVPPECDGI